MRIVYGTIKETKLIDFKMSLCVCGGNVTIKWLSVLREYADALEYLQLLISASDAAGATSQSFAIGSDTATVTGRSLSPTHFFV